MLTAFPWLFYILIYQQWAIVRTFLYTGCVWSVLPYLHNHGFRKIVTRCEEKQQ